MFSLDGQLAVHHSCVAETSSARNYGVYFHLPKGQRVNLVYDCREIGPRVPAYVTIKRRTRDEVIVKHPTKNWDIIVAGYGATFDEAIANFKFLR